MPPHPFNLADVRRVWKFALKTASLGTVIPLHPEEDSFR